MKLIIKIKNIAMTILESLGEEVNYLCKCGHQDWIHGLDCNICECKEFKKA